MWQPPSTSPLSFKKTKNKTVSLKSWDQDEKKRGRGGVKRREGLYIDMNPRRRRLFTQSLPTARSPFTQQPLFLKLPALPPLPTPFDALNPSFLWGKPFSAAAAAWMWGCAGVATQSISFTCVESNQPQDSAYRVCVFFSSLFNVTLKLKRDPWASLYMNNPCVFRVVSNERRLCLNACPIKQSDGEIKGCLYISWVTKVGGNVLDHIYIQIWLQTGQVDIKMVKI